MRPRRVAVDNGDFVHDLVLDATASMRPRRVAVDNAHDGQKGQRLTPASMRPRRVAVDNLVALDEAGGVAHRFNEATACCRG